MDTVIKAHFQHVDPILFSVIETVNLAVLTKERPSEYFASLCRQIIGQQLSGKVADSIYERFERLFFKRRITVKTFRDVTDAQLRSTGMSWSKVTFLRDLAQNVERKAIDFTSLRALPDEEVKAALMRIKGIGPWTAEMFLMFTLHRPDVFSFGDLGLKRGIQRLYGFKNEPSLRTMKRIVNKWKPYRTIAARVLWASLDI